MKKKTEQEKNKQKVNNPRKAYETVINTETYLIAYSGMPQKF